MTTTKIVPLPARLQAAQSVLDDTDVANARRLIEQHGANLRYTPERGWLYWDGMRWCVDEKSIHVQQLAKDTALAIFDEIKSSIDRDAKMRHAKRAQSKSAIEAMVHLARSEPAVACRLTDFDRDPWLLNVMNGTLSLRATAQGLGPFRLHDRHDLITNLAPVEFDGSADCPLWERFVARVVDDDEELYRYMRRLVGYLLVGDASEQCLQFLYGVGANGKSVFCEVLLRLMGDYAITVSPDLVMLRRHAVIPNDIARLRGKRVAFMNETSQGARFDEAKLKDLTGGDTLTGRFLHQEFFDFAPTHRLVIRGNHKPVISGTDDGIWRRLRLIPFAVQIPPGEQDRQLATKLYGELSGILNWAISGCLEWQRDGLAPPPAVTAAVESYREESDTLGRFIAEHCDVRRLAQVKSSVLFGRYQEFAQSTGERWMPAKDLPQEMVRRGFQWKRTKAGGLYEGLELANPANESTGDGW